MRAHPVAAMFPMMSDAELRELADDIAKNGLREPIVVDDFDWRIAHPRPSAREKDGYKKQLEWGMDYQRAIEDGGILVVDGRNRYAACKLAGIGFDYTGDGDGPVIEYRSFGGDVERDEGEAVDFIVSKNIHRRHLTESQRAIVAAKIATLKQGARTDLVETSTKSQAQAAEQLNVSRESVVAAKKVIEHGAPELVAAVVGGAASVSAAAQIAEKPIDEQQTIVAGGKKKVQAAAKTIKEEKRKAAKKEKPSVFLDDKPLAEDESPMIVTAGSMTTFALKMIDEYTGAHTDVVLEAVDGAAVALSKLSAELHRRAGKTPKHVAYSVVMADIERTGGAQ